MRTFIITPTSTRTDAHAVLDLIDYRGVTVSRQYDERGPSSDWFYYVVTVEMGGEEFDFNSVTDARRWIDGELDTDHGFDPMREWGITASRAI
jgi:hypothetical protein